MKPAVCHSYTVIPESSDVVILDDTTVNPPRSVILTHTCAGGPPSVELTEEIVRITAEDYNRYQCLLQLLNG